MLPSQRANYNQGFTSEKYQTFKEDIYHTFDYTPPFRIAESPIFIPASFKEKLLIACEEISQTIYHPKFKEWSQGALVGEGIDVPNEDKHTLFLQMDFGICTDERGHLSPQLIEVQGFPSLYFFQALLAEKYKQHFAIPANYSSYLEGLSVSSYLALLKKNIIGDTDPKQVILLEIEPEKQATYIDFLCTEAQLGIKVLCLSKLKKRGKRLYYLDENSVEIPVRKIFNRVIFDELRQRPDLKREFYFQEEVDVEWIGHPNWFYRISKYIMPFLKSEYVPPCFYVDSLRSYPSDLENYVLKPLFSFAGAGVQLHVTKALLDALPDKKNYILQKKVKYAPVLEGLDGERSKCEIRMLMLWEKGAEQAKAINNLVRLTKGEMVGVKYNKNKEWVGASVGFFEPTPLSND